MHRDRELTFVEALATHYQTQHLKPHSDAHEYYQTSLLSAVMQGVYDGNVSVEELLKHGDFGLGTFNALDGEMIVLDRIAYRLTGDGKAAIAENDALTPYAAVINFEPDLSLALNTPIKKIPFEEGLDALADSPNLFYAISFTGQISHIKYRNVLRQEPPYKPLLDVVKTQAEFELNNVSGTILGFRCPNYAMGIGVPGYHLHFISDDRTTGGHVLDYVLNSGRVEIDHTSSLHLELPETQAFSEADLNAGADSGSIAKAEGD